jgi:hypothetical protein
VPVSKRGSPAKVPRWFSTALLMSMLLGCGSDLPRDTGGGTVTGRVSYSGTATDTLIDPWLVIYASAEPLTLGTDFRFQSVRAVRCDSIPQEGFSYKLTGLYPGQYFIFAVIATFGTDGVAVPHSLGAYPNLLEQWKVTVTKEDGVTGIDFTVYDL